MAVTDYYTRFQRSVSRSLKWQLYSSQKTYFLENFLQKKINVFMDPLASSLHLLERRLLELFSINMTARRRGLSIEECDYEDLRNEARLISLSDIFQEMQLYPLTTTIMLYYLFQDKDSTTPALITIGNVLSKYDGKPSNKTWDSYSLRNFVKQKSRTLGSELSAWLTFRDGTILDPTLKFSMMSKEDISLLNITSINDLDYPFRYDPLLVGGSVELMQFFGNV